MSNIIFELYYQILLLNYNTNNNDFSIITVISVNKCFLINQDYFFIQTLSNELNVIHSEFNYSELINLWKMLQIYKEIKLDTQCQLK